MRMKMKRFLVSAAALAAICGAYLVSGQEITIHKKEGAAAKGIFVKADPNGDLWIKVGQVQQKVKAVDYSYARLKDKPKDVDAAEKVLASKNFAKAAADFAALYEKYRFVGYDVLCIWGESSALAAQGKKPEAIARLKALDKYELVDDEKATEFFDSRKLLANLYIDESKFDDALAILGELGQANDDDMATFGFNSRGSILLKQGKKKDAVLMFLRTVLLFPVENKERPKALVLVANTLKEMQDNRGGIFAEMLKSEYPGNPLIAELK